jgi:hypothetical protein
VACQADLSRRLDEVCIIFGSMDVMATEARDTAAIHQALDEVITLHPVLVTGSVREMTVEPYYTQVMIQL